jgi:2-polyprenyl-3-methyl-5-hydroxy-6-metoxy-1,4-benzoquinol methylase
MNWEELDFEPYFEGQDNFQESYKEFSAQHMVNRETGHMRFWPMPNPALLDDFYTNAFTRSELATTPEIEFNPGVIQVAAGVISHIKSIDPSESMGSKWRVFDLGCGFGGFVWAMQQNGMDAWGNELNPNWVNAANVFCDNKLFYGQFAEVQQHVRNKYNLVFVSHTLEHLPDPIKTLREVKEKLEDDGLVYVNVPNSRSDRFRKNGRRSGIDYGNFPMHLNFFTPASMKYLAERAGLKIVQLRTRPLDELTSIQHADDVNRFDDLYLGGELFALLTHESNTSFVLDQNIEEKISVSFKNIPEMYMQSRRSSPHLLLARLKKALAAAYRLSYFRKSL